MPIYPTLEAQETSREMVSAFLGYYSHDITQDGQWQNEENITGELYPVFSPRAARVTVKSGLIPNGLLEKDSLLWVDGTRVFYNGDDITDSLPSGVMLTDSEKTLVSMGAYVLIWPDRVYINTEDYSDSGYLENRTDTGPLTETSPVRYTLAMQDGNAYGNVTLGSTAPENPANGDMWLDTSSVPHTLKTYGESSGIWVQVVTTYVKISAVGIGKGFEKYDGVNISGCSADGAEAELAEQVTALNGSHIVYDVGDDFIVVTGILDRSVSQSDGEVTVSRTVPDMDFVTESQNRIWGCRYGRGEDGKTVNEIYCCALGDFRNWEQYQGLSTDSYRASVGSDGVWTGAVTHNGYPIFFKENCLHKVYISTSGAHQIVEQQCRGVQKGSHRSLKVVNEVLYYKGRSGVMAYDGSTPAEVGDDLGDTRYFSAVGGVFGNRYYLNMCDGDGNWHLFVYDTARGIWHRESGEELVAMAKCDDGIYALTAAGELVGLNGVKLNGMGTEESAVSWFAETGAQGFETPDRKYVSRFNLRLKIPDGSHLKLEIEYDSSGEWESQGEIYGSGDRTFLLPVRPRRCDHFRLRLSGEGDVRLYTITRVYESGSDEP